MENPAAPLPSLTLHADIDQASIDPRSITTTWLKNLEEKILRNQVDAFPDLFISESWWRDIISLSWTITTKRGSEEISQYLHSQAVKSGFGKFKVIDGGALQPRLSDLGGLIWIESGFTFENKVGTGRGIVRLANVGPEEWRAWIVHTNLDELTGYPEKLPQEVTDSKHEKDTPQVLIIGAGHSGLALAARLKALNVSYLVVDKSAQTASAWRMRYDSIRSHTPRYTDKLPYLDFPETFSDFLTKEEIISWMETYPAKLSLNIELGSSVGRISFDESSHQYSVSVTSSDGKQRTVTSHHLVLATGLLSNNPARPSFPNESAFKGQIYHSISHKSASLTPDLSRKRIAIIGAGTSAFDIAQDFASAGAEAVTLIQRSPLFVLSTQAQDQFVLAGWAMMRAADADLAGASFPFPVALTLLVGATQAMAQHDAAMLARLEKAGLVVKRGEDGIGLLHHQLLKAGHFYIDQGACDMIVDGRIKVVRCQEGVARFEEEKVVLSDGTSVEADVVVIATGFERMDTVTEEIMGREFMEKVGQIGALDEDNERIGWWRPTAVPGFWYMTGSFLWSRMFSKPLALQIKAAEEGLNKSF